jgi:hypothetical protein
LDERPNVACSSLASLALSASISKRCSMIAALAAAVLRLALDALF